jgi:ribosome-binding protein aMBF1 (putative translation factor)
MPPLETVKLLEKFLKTSLIETVEAEVPKTRKGTKALTLGDIVDIRKRK